jgi:hypothetical protein
MDKNMLELLGRALLNAAQSQRQWEEMNKIIGQNIAADNPLLDTFLKSFGWHNQEKTNEENIIEFTEKSFAPYKEFIKAYLTMFNVVPQEKHLDLIKENENLKAKIAQLEKIINNKNNTVDKEVYDAEKLVNNLTQIMSNQTQQFKELMKQLSQPSKKAATTKKK